MRKALFKNLFIVVTLRNFRTKSGDKSPRFDLFVIIFKFKISQYLWHFHVNVIFWRGLALYCPIIKWEKNKFYICYDLENLQAINGVNY